MADDLRDSGAMGGFNDDRLLAFALGLADDPELVEASAADEALGRRLEEIEADVARIGAGVRAAVPEPDAAYTDLGDPRWAGLRELLQPGADRPAQGRSRARRWLRVLAPVAAVALALAIGVAVIQHQSQSRSNVAERSAKTSDSYGAAAGAPLAAPAQDVVAQLNQQLQEFAVVVLAKARAAHGVFQQFVVVRILKGRSPAVVRLQVADQPADVGRLHLLMLRPTAAPSVNSTQSAAPATPWPSASSVPEPAGTGATTDIVTSAQPVLYVYQGAMAVARELPAGTDPASVQLP